jgi:Uma2 family endonuclease
MLFDILSWHYEARPDVLVSSDLKMLWRIRGLPGPAPDVAVIPGVRDKFRMRPSFDVRREGTRPVLILEVVSEEPEQWENDHREKVAIYERAGVEEYVILDPPTGSGDRCALTGRRLNAAGRYEPIAPDAAGRLLSATTGLLFAVSPGGTTLHVFDAATGERLLTSREAREAQAAAEQRAERAEAELARLRAEVERLKKSGL